MTVDSPAATTPTDRFIALDTLRGVALLGVLLSNLDGWFRVNPYDRPAGVSLVDLLAEAGLELFIQHKAFILFSLLFGVGLAVLAERLGARRKAVLARRLVVLLGFGLVHLFLIWDGDILTEYAVSGMIVLPLLFAGARTLALAGVAAMAVFFVVALAGGNLLQHGVDPNAAYAAFVLGDYGDRLVFALEELEFLARIHLYILPRTVGLMLLGAAAWKGGLLRKEKALRLAALVLIPAGLALSAFATQGPVVYELAPLVLAAGYAAVTFGFAPAVERRLGIAAAVGRMAFTNYVTQSVVLGLIFFGHGLALQGQVGAAAGLAIGLALWLAQAAFSVWWLRAHPFGPLEWLWRSATYGRAQPWRRA